MTDPWKEAHDRLSDYVTAVVEDADNETQTRLFVTYQQALRKAQNYCLHCAGTVGDDPTCLVCNSEANTELSESGEVVREHPHADDRRTFKVGFFAWVETEAFDASEAGLVAEAALGWPGSWSLPHDPTESEGVLNGYRVKARLLRTQAMTSAPAENEGD